MGKSLGLTVHQLLHGEVGLAGEFVAGNVERLIFALVDNDVAALDSACVGAVRPVEVAGCGTLKRVVGNGDGVITLKRDATIHGAESVNRGEGTLESQKGVFKDSLYLKIAGDGISHDGEELGVGLGW